MENYQQSIFSKTINPLDINPNITKLIALIQILHNQNKIQEPTSIKTTRDYDYTWPEFILNFNNSYEEEQIQMLEYLSRTNGFSYIYYEMALNPFNYQNLTFLDELHHLLIHKQIVKYLLINSIEAMICTIGISYSDDIRYKCYSILGAFLGLNDLKMKNYMLQFNKLIYENLYDFHNYYRFIEKNTIESLIIFLNEESSKALKEKMELSEELKEKINESIKNLGNYAFFKMRRSPKDAFSSLEKTIQSQWEKFYLAEPDEDPRDYFMRVNNADNILMLCKHSQRIKDDLQDNFSSLPLILKDNIIGLHVQLQSIILRKWEKLGVEFRCFICQGNINAVSLYGSSNGEHFTKEEKIGYEKFIKSVSFKNIMLTIPYNHAIVDISIDQNHHMKIIEINPYGKISSSAKFSWILDKEILSNGYVNNNNYIIVRW